ncbi:hypothetical protein GGF31_005665 [Allomyces arbusculus]|nr:hypothetical protein GGF31_005665 [Allomyces arbusculus]
MDGPVLWAGRRESRVIDISNMANVLNPDQKTQLLKCALQLARDKTVLDVLVNVPGIIQAEAWPRLHDPISAVIQQRDADAQLTTCITALDLLVSKGAPREQWDPLLQIGLDALPDARSNLA